MSALYKAKFEVGSTVRIASHDELEEFRLQWVYHNKLQEIQLEFACKLATVDRIGFYHGGYVLYKLKDVPGIWHEVCLREP